MVLLFPFVHLPLCQSCYMHLAADLVLLRGHHIVLKDRVQGAFRKSGKAGSLLLAGRICLLFTAVNMMTDSDAKNDKRQGGGGRGGGGGEVSE
jgi:hypothetical protein